MSTDFTVNPFQGMSDVPDDELEPVEGERVDYSSDDNDPDDVPVGTTKEIMDWVGDDKDRAQRALDVEESKGDDGLKGLKRELNKMLEG